MNRIQRICFLLLTVFLASSCTGVKPRLVMAKTLTFTAADFGPAEARHSLLGDVADGQIVVVVHVPRRDLPPGSVQVPAPRSVKHLNTTVKQTPPGPARDRMVRTRALILEFYDQRRMAFQSVPPFVGRGFMTRQALMPGIGTSF